MPLEPPIVKDRILLHLFDYLRFGEAFDVPLEMTQEGIANAVWIDIRHVVQNARPLIAEGLVHERTAHVKGGRRRRKVYALTEAGKLRAINLRRKLFSEAVRVRDADEISESGIEQVLEQARGKMSLLEIVRQATHGDAVDLRNIETRQRATYVELLSDAPKVEEFLGRQRELEALTQEDGPKISVVKGVAGIGKSTLAAQVCIQRRGSTNLFWHRVRSWDNLASMLAALVPFMSALGKPGLRTILSEGQAELAPRVLREDFPSIEAFLVFDDIHEAGEEVADFLEFLKVAIAESKKVKALVLTRRHIAFFDRRDVLLEGLVQEIELTGLEAADIEAVLPREEYGEALIDMARHPLFLKLLRRASSGRPRAKTIQDIHRFIEETIYTDLTEAERKVMKVASLYRVPIPAEALLYEPAISYDDLLGLMEKALITRMGGEGLEVHDTIRDFFKKVLTDAEGQELRKFAIKSLNEHAVRAREADNLSLCVAYLSNAAELAPPASEWPSVYEALGDALEQIGNAASAVEAFRKGLLVEAPAETGARLHRKIAIVLIEKGEFPTASSEVEEGFRALGTAVNVERGWLNLAACRFAFWTDDWEEAKEYGLAALSIFQTFPDLLGRGQALLFVAHAEAHLPKGNPTVAQEYLDRALATADAMADTDFTNRVRGEAAYLLAFHLGQVEEAAKHLAILESRLDLPDVSLKRVSFLSLRAHFDLQFLEDYEAAESRYNEILSLGQEFDSSFNIATAKNGLAMVAYYRGRFGDAYEGYREYASEAQDQGLLSMAVEGMCRAADSSLLDGDLPRFKEMVSDLRDKEVSSGVEARPLLTTVIFALSSFVDGDRDEALRLLDKAIGIEKSTRLIGDQGLPYLARSAVHGAMRRDGQAEKDLETARKAVEATSQKAALAVLRTRQQLLTATLKHAPGARVKTG